MTPDGIDTFVLQEFRLHVADSSGEAAGIVAGFADHFGSAVPLLTSIDDRRDVAMVHAVPAGERSGVDLERREALDRLTATWGATQRYAPRIAERSGKPPSSYRLAVTGSGINNVEADLLAGMSMDTADVGTSVPLGLLWIGVPVDSYAGLLVLVGNDDDISTTRPDPREWPLPLSESLGVRIYTGQ